MCRRPRTSGVNWRLLLPALAVVGFYEDAGISGTVGTGTVQVQLTNNGLGRSRRTSKTKSCCSPFTTAGFARMR